MSVNPDNLTAKTTLLDFLKTGGILVFPSNSCLKGDPENNYIDLRNRFGQSAGLRVLNEEGLSLALNDEDIFHDTDTLIANKLNPQSTLLDFMALNGNITLSNGSLLCSDTSTQYIDMIGGFDGFLGVQTLDEAGLTAALRDKDMFPDLSDEDGMHH